MDALGLRYMQIEFSFDSKHLEEATHLPSKTLAYYFRKLEFVTELHQYQMEGMVALIRVTYDDSTALKSINPQAEILEVITQNSTSALVKMHFTGPIVMLFQSVEQAWWTVPTTLTKKSMKITIRGTKETLRYLREELGLLIGNGFSVKIGSEKLTNQEFFELLPKRQNRVILKAIEMGYYDRPRKCTQRSIAAELEITQATVSEHLQTAEASIIHAFSSGV